MRKILLHFVCILLAFAATALWAQSVGGTLSGRITSANGAAVPNAAITVTNITTNASQKALTGPDGTFSISGLSPGTYRVDVESAGYKHTSQQNIELTTAGPASVNITLQAGNVNETVEIKATAPMTQSDNGEFSVGIQSRPITEIPVIDRDSQQLVGLESGITPPVPALDFGLDPARNRFYSNNGQFPYINQNYLDGVWNQEPYRNTAIRVVPDEAVQQLNISTSNLVMDKGFTGGAYVVDNTRGGTNAWHGSLFEFWSGNILRSRSFFDTVDKNAPRFNFNQFGLTAGGAIVPDKTFAFLSYEGMYQRGDQTSVSTVPMPAVLGGNFSSIPGVTLYNPFSGTAAGAFRTPISGNVITSINPTAAAIARFLPPPNQPGFANNYVANSPFALTHQKGDARIDQHFTDHTSAFVRYGYSNDYALENSPLGPVIGSGLDGRVVAQNAIISLSHAFGDRLITEFRMGYNRYDQHLFAATNQAPLAAALGTSLGPNGLVGISIPGLPLIGSPSYLPEHPVDNNFNWVWNWGLHTARHSFKWGLDVRRVRSDGFLDSPLSAFGANGTAFFGPGATLLNNGAPLSANAEFYNSLAAFLLGAPSQVGAGHYFVPNSIRQTQYGVWLGDNLHVLHRLDLDLGVRYEVFSPLEPSQNGGTAFYNPANNTFTFAGVGGTDLHSSPYQLHNIAPRIGFAFNLNDRTVIRGGYGIQYFQMPYMFSGFNAPFVGAVSGVQGTYGVAPFSGTFGPTVTTRGAPFVLANGTSTGLPLAILPHTIATPYVETYSFQIQRDFYYGTVLSVGYVGNIDRHLPGLYNTNAALPGTGSAGLPFASFGLTSPVWAYDTGLTSNYNALQVNWNKRMSQGLSFIASYTWSRALGYTNQYDMLLAPNNLRANYGPLDWDRQHVLSITHLWELPFGRHGDHLMTSLLGGWQLNGVISWHTGVPLTVTADSLLCACPGNTVMASAIQPNGVNGGFGSGQSYFNNAAFIAPTSGFGNLGRGAFRGPDFWNYDMSVFKNFRIMDRFNFQVRGDAYNLANTTHEFNPITNINSPGFGQSNFASSFTQEGFGQGAALGAFGREVNLGLRVQF